MDQPTSFEEFWPYYVSQHLDPWCRRLHVAGTAAGIGCVALSPLNPWLLVAAPIVGYGCSWIGHFAFEKNTPASWYSLRHFAWSFRGDMRMLARTLQGSMANEVERARELYPAHSPA
jgi:hypothetical protein